MVEQHGHSSPHQDGVAFEYVYIPQPTGLIKGKVAGEERGVDVSHIDVRIVARKLREMAMKLRRFGSKGLKE